MRIFAYEYVRSAVGPTVTEICERGLVLDDPAGKDNGSAQPDILSPFVSKLWNDIYCKSAEHQRRRNSTSLYTLQYHGRISLCKFR